MHLGKYSKDKAVYIVMFLLMSIFTAFFLRAQGLGWYPVVFLISGYALALLIPLAVEYRMKKKFYGELAEDLNGLDKKYYLSEMISEPLFAEGQITYEALRSGNKAMNDEIAAYKLATREYREYIELWIHEVKTPVASLKLFIDNHQSQFSAEVYEELEQIDRYLEQVLYYARCSSAEKDYLIRKTTLEQIVKELLKQHSRLFIKNKVRISLGALDYEIHTDVKWLSFVLVQILINAVKYKSPEPEINITAAAAGGNVILHIRDNGIGIPAEDLPRVFEKGFTGHNGRVYSKSTGMGLYICKKLCDKLQIPLTIDSEHGKGTHVQIVFAKNHYYTL